MSGAVLSGDGAWEAPLLADGRFGFETDFRSPYAYNCRFGNWGIPGGLRYLPRIKNQDQIFMWSESQEDPFTGEGPTGLLAPTINWNGSPSFTYFYHPDKRHHGGSPVLYVDSHGDWRAQEKTCRTFG